MQGSIAGVSVQGGLRDLPHEAWLHEIGREVAAGVPDVDAQRAPVAAWVAAVGAHQERLVCLLQGPVLRVPLAHLRSPAQVRPAQRVRGAKAKHFNARLPGRPGLVAHHVLR